MNVKGWLSISFLGIVIIALQLFTPDLVPDIIDGLIINNTSRIVVVLLLKATLIFYYIGGFALFLVGVIGALVSFNRSQSE